MFVQRPIPVSSNMPLLPSRSTWKINIRKEGEGYKSELKILFCLMIIKVMVKIPNEGKQQWVRVEKEKKSKKFDSCTIQNKEVVRESKLNQEWPFRASAGKSPLTAPLPSNFSLHSPSIPANHIALSPDSKLQRQVDLEEFGGHPTHCSVGIG